VGTAAAVHHDNMHAGSLRLLLTLLLLAACTPKPGGDSEAASTGEGASEAASTSDGVPDATLGHSSAPTTGTPDTTITTNATTLEDDLTSAGTTAITTSGADEPSVCEAMCQLAGSCGLEDQPFACASACADDLAASAPACRAATEVMLGCLAGLSCEQLADAISGDPGHPCAAEQLAKHEACDEVETCDSGGGGDMGGQACLLELQCAGQPAQRMECDAEQCVCLEDGAQVGSCAADGVCLALEQLGAKAESCCGFTGAP